MITVDCRSVPVHPSGLLAYQVSLSRHLPAIAPHRHFCFLRHAAAPGRLVHHPNAHEVCIGGEPDSLRALRKVHPQDGVALYHATGGLLPARIDVPIVTTVHDVLWLTEPRWLRPPGLRGHLTSGVCRRFQQDALRRSARIIVPSQATRRAIEEIAPFVMDRVRVIPHGVNPIFHPVDRSSSKAMDDVKATCARLLGGATRFVLDVGRAAAYRNHDGLLRSFATAFRSDREVHLALVQPMTDKAKSIIKLAASLGLEDRVHVLSSLASRDLVALYQGAICLCHPTLHESYGTVVVEAMASGCPVITSGRAAVGEVAEGVARLVNPEREEEIEGALRAVAYEPNVADRMRAKGLARAATLEGRTMAQATWDVYAELIEPKQLAVEEVASAERSDAILPPEDSAVMVARKPMPSQPELERRLQEGRVAQY